ncbi:hypothetical protein [Armatimonas rosea]|uniref:4-amino-4-deoxy-L-arabinose transferase n=1 Tax=Armatimonas rosea TaxID=685828 RepID=A0A7W9SW54_ARMRO|nr:hypothetical protein [Armatimonas rosea]MBB6053009.1 hypothetical protein [Armatimonas rosea]
MQRSLPLLTLLATLGLYLAFLLPRLLWIDETGVWVGQEHLWSDWPWHLAMARQLAAGIWTHPLIAGESLHYPFAMALITAGLLKLGVGLTAAFLFPILPLWLLLLVGMYRFWTPLLSKPWLALLPIFLFFLAAGPGGLRWLLDIKTQGLGALLAPPHEYGRALEEWGYEWYAGNFLVGMLLPQRAFLPGMTLTIWLLCGLQRASCRRQWGLIGLGAGLLPIVHVHSLIALIAFGAALLWPHRARWREWGLAFLPGAALAIVLYLIYLRPENPYPHFVKLQLGFEAKTPLDWFMMWWRFWGMALPVTFCGLFFLPRGSLRGIVGAAAGLFVLANVILFQPIAWDNSKVFLWAYFGFSGAMACLLGHFGQRGVGGKVIASVLCFSLTITGLAELIRLQRTDVKPCQVVSRDDMLLAESLREQTPEGAIFLTGMDIANAPLWAGRPIFLGFGGWMPNFGYDHRQRETDLKKMFSGASDAPELLKKWHIDFVFIGPGERSSWGANEAWYAAHYPLLCKVGDKSVYQIKR